MKAPTPSNDSSTENLTPSDITVKGTGPAPTGPYGHDDAADDALIVETPNGTVRVSRTGIRRVAYDYTGSIPEERVDMDRLCTINGHLHAETIMGDKAIELVPDYSLPSGDVNYDVWEMTVIDNDPNSKEEAVYERGGDQ